MLFALDSAEATLVLLSARREVDRLRLREVLRAPIRWDLVWRAAELNGLLPLLYWHLREEDIPADFRDRLKRRFLLNVARNLRYAAELVRVTALLEAQGIAVASWKGPVAAEDLYGNLALRDMSDVDLIVPPALRDRTIELLIADGYRDPMDLTLREEKAWYRFSKERPFVGGRGITIDFHWGFNPERFPLRLDVAELSSRLIRKRAGSAEVPTFPDEEMAVILASHGTKHLWERLEWLAGFSELLRRPLDWRRVAEIATEAHALRQLQFTVLLAHELLDAPVPVELRVDDSRFRPAIEAVKQIVFRTTATPAWARFPAQRRLYDRQRDKVRGALEPIFRPQLSDWRALPLPDALHGLYWILRPLRLGWKYGKALLIAGKALLIANC